MKVVKISAVWCSACIVMNKVWNNILNKIKIDTMELDYDFDELEVKKYNPGEVLPVFIFYDGDVEVTRISGEISEQELMNIITNIGGSDE